MPHPDTDHDLDTLAGLGPLIENEEYHRATPCIRLTFVTDGNLADRSAALDGWLARAAELVRPEVAVYGGAGGAVPNSQRRKPKPEDWALFDGFSGRLQADMDRRAGGIPQESGSFFFGDTLKDGASATRFYGLGSHPWRFSVALSLDLWRSRREQVNRLVEDLAALGDAYDSGGYGFAMNLWASNMREQEAELFHPVAERFRLIDMVDPQVWRPSKLDALGAGGAVVAPLPRPLLYPIQPWTLLGKAALSALDIPEQTIRDLAPEVFAVVEHGHGFLVKLWPEPILGDVNADADLAPAFALGRALAPAYLAEADRFAKAWVSRLGWPEDNASWYRRFSPAPGED